MIAIKVAVSIVMLAFIVHADEAGVNRCAERLIKSYPDTIGSISQGIITFKNGSKLPLGGPAREVGQLFKKLGEKDVDPNSFFPVDMFGQNYPPLRTPIPTEAHPPAAGFDPGRIRSTQFFDMMYGDRLTQAEKNLTSIPWITSFDFNGKPATKIRITKINGVDRKLVKIRDTLLALPAARRKALNGILFEVKGFSGFHARKVRGENFPSAHSWGIAVDVNWDTAYYHRDSAKKYANNIPQDVVDIFEANGFIWGGRWSHFDSMHFEYRPELLTQ